MPRIYSVNNRGEEVAADDVAAAFIVNEADPATPDFLERLRNGGGLSASAERMRAREQAVIPPLNAETNERLHAALEKARERREKSGEEREKSEGASEARGFVSGEGEGKSMRAEGARARGKR